MPHWLLVLTLALFHLVGPVPTDLGVHNGALAPVSYTHLTLPTNREV